MSCSCDETLPGTLVVSPVNQNRKVVLPIRSEDAPAVIHRGETSVKELTGALPIRSFYADTPVSARNVDYETIGTRHHFRACVDAMLAIGRRSATTYTFAGALPNPLITVTGMELALGILIEWGLGRDQGRPFTLGITTNLFHGLEQNMVATSLHDVDRNVDLKLECSCPGGKIYLPFAYRETTSMPEARIQPGISLDGGAGAGTGTCTLTVPTALTDFAATAELITAHSPALAELIALVESAGD